MAGKLNISLSKDQQKLLAVAVVLLGVGGFAYVKYFWLPVSKRIEDATAKIAQLDSDIKAAQGAAARRDQIKKELDRLREQASDAEHRLPRTLDIPLVIDTMSKLCRRYKVEQGQFAPGGQSPQTLYIEYPWAMSVTGYYHDVGRFLASLALEERIYSVRNVNFSGGNKEKPGFLGVTFTLVAYTYKGG